MNKNRIYIIIASGFLIVLLHYAGALRMLENSVIKILAPIEGKFFYLGQEIDTYYDEKNISKEELLMINKRLEEENEKLLAEMVGLKVLADENKILREQLDFYTQFEYQKVLTNIINKGEGLTVNQIVTLDRGSNDGIKVGQAVIGGQGHIVGKIFKVTNKLSYAYLITDERSLLAATISDKATIDGLTNGELGLTIKMDFVPQQTTEQLALNDIVITSGLEQNIPKGLIIGKIQEVMKEDNDLFQTAIIDPIVDLNSLSIVSVIIY